MNTDNMFISKGRLVSAPKGNYKEEASGERKLLNVWITLGVDRGHKEDSGTDFIQYVVFGKTAEFVMRNSVPNTDKGLAPMFRKGAKVEVVGAIRTSKREVNGETSYITSLVVEDIKPLSEAKKLEEWEAEQEGKKQSNQTAPTPAPTPAPQPEPAPVQQQQAIAPAQTEQQRIDAEFPFPD